MTRTIPSLGPRPNASVTDSHLCRGTITPGCRSLDRHRLMTSRGIAAMVLRVAKELVVILRAG